MALRLRERSGPAVHAATREGAGTRSRQVLTGLVLGQTAAMVVLVGLDGSALRRSVRVLSVLAIGAIAVFIARRAGRVGIGAVALLLGIVGTVVGAGIGGVYAVKVGVSTTTVAALVALATGLVLLGWGSVGLVRAMSGWWRLAALPAALVLLVFVLMPLALAVNVTNRPASPLGSRTPADLGLAYQDVAFSTGDGVRLSGWYLPSKSGAAVVLLHGAGSTRSAVLDHAGVLAARGYGVLLMDTRGHGRSEGRAMDLGWYGDLDIAAAISFLEDRSDVEGGRIGVVGMSMGGEQAIAAAGADARIKAVVAEGATGMQLADHGWLSRYGVRGSIQRAVDWVTYTAAGVLSGAPRPMTLRDSISAASRPMLLIAGGDVPDEMHAGRYFREASPGSVDLWVVPGAGHTRGLATRPAEWEARVTAFLESALGTGSEG